ncbi:MAG: deoxyribose-phosphate aldolase [Eubacteriales bacterium]|nr:deoxyribose-phosphate aldolase [Eubacteriales bacterium]
MTNQEILKKVDHTLLKQTSTWEQIKVVCDDAIRFNTASVCIPPSFVAKAKREYGEKLNICTVIGFPNGYNTTAVKVFEAQQAIKDGANEIDMVVNLGWVQEGDYDSVLKEISQIRAATEGKILKVIVETCFLTQEQKIKLCEVVTRSGADFIKTSTGFGGGGATREDIELFSRHIGKNVKMKAAGGIKNLQDAEDFITLGCERLGTSSIVKAVKELKSE